MEIPVLILKLPNGQGYEARTGEPFAATAQAATEQEALSKLGSAVREQVSSGARLLSLQLDVPQFAIPAVFLPDDEFTRGWTEEIAEYRRRRNAEPDPWELTDEGQAAIQPSPSANGSPSLSDDE